MVNKLNSKKSADSSVRVLILFCVVVFVAIIFSLGFKLFSLIQNSKYSSNHNFIIAFIYKQDMDFVDINAQQKTLSHLEIRGGGSLSKTQREIGLIPDTTITLSQAFSMDRLSTYFMAAAWKKKEAQSNLNIYDLYRLSLATSRQNKQGLQSQKIHFPLDDNAWDKTLEQLFLDSTINQENKTVSIVNAAGVMGLGTRLERALSRVGINVISVRNADEIESSSSIRSTTDKSYTAEHLHDLLGFPITMSTSQQEVSDIIITLGKNMTQTNAF